MTIVYLEIPHQGLVRGTVMPTMHTDLTTGNVHRTMLDDQGREWAFEEDWVVSES